MFLHPPSYIRTLLTTNVVLGITSTTAILPAPGVGMAYRIVGWHIAANATIAAGSIIHARLINAFDPLGMAARTISESSPFADGHIPEPGITTTPNTVVDVQYISDTATLQFFSVVYYYLDQVT